MNEAAWHRLLLSLAGRLPDEVVTRARALLAAGRPAEAARAAGSAALAHGVALTAEEAGLLGAHEAARAERAVAPPYGMAPTGPDVLARHGDDIPYRLDLSIRDGGPGGPDPVDTTATAWCAGDPHPYALWRSWRYPADGTPQGPARRIYLVQVPDESALAGVTAGLQATLAACGERDPQVETFADDAGLPGYRQRALSCSALLWTAAPPKQPRLVPDAAPARTAPPDAAEVAGYLDAGRSLELVGDAGRIFRTDGTWIWPASAGAEVRDHGREPYGPLLARIRDSSYRPPAVGAVAAHRALCVLYQPPPAPDELPDTPDISDLAEAAEANGPAEPAARYWRRAAVVLTAGALLGAAGVAWAAQEPAAAPAPTAMVVVETTTAAPTPARSTRAAVPVRSSAPASRRPAPPRTRKPSASRTPKPAPATTRPVTPAGQTRRITATAVLRPGDAWSTDRLGLALTASGDVVLRDRGRAVWAAGTGGRDARELVFQADGNLVLYAGDNATIWSSGTPGNDGAVLTLGGDGKVRIALGGRTLWTPGGA
ncbi:hypothetical protein Asp14428_75520 [Actinoplanes sp. NBRC 14428]|nr:hypothetical protein Asp14428_75520 [Actinoplanes sp. NBRC 14428]